MKICIPLKEKNIKKLKMNLKKAQKSADVIEIWLDHFKQLTDRELRTLIKSASKPVLAVARGKAEKGDFEGSEEERIHLLQRAVLCGAKFVDVGIQTAPKLILALKLVCRKASTKLIISSHDWGANMPSFRDMQKVVLSAKKLGADIVKIAVNIRNWADNIPLFELTKFARQKDIRIIAIGMGEKGKVSRIGCPLLGAEFTYIALDERSKTAPGQLTLKEMQPFLD